jgi:hypothetical protein
MVASLISTCIGGLIALSGSVVGQRLQARSASKSRVEQYSREDRYRLHRERVDVYSQFYVDMKVLRRAVMGVDPAARQSDEAVLEAQDAAWRTDAKLRLLGTSEVVIAARSMMRYLSSAVSGGEFDLHQWSMLVSAYRTAARQDLIGPCSSDVPELSGEAEWTEAAGAAVPSSRVSTRSSSKTEISTAPSS